MTRRESQYSQCLDTHHKGFTDGMYSTGKYTTMLGLFLVDNEDPQEKQQNTSKTLSTVCYERDIR